MTMTTHSDSCAPAGAEAISIYEAIGGRVVLANDLDRIPVPSRRPPAT